MKNGLCRFIGFCEDNHIAPNEVSDATFDRFLADLETGANLSDPHACHRRSSRLWNEAAASIAGWPQTRITLPNYRKPRLSLPINSYPASLQEEFARYLDFLRGGSDRFAKGPRQKRMAESTVRQRGVEILLALSALVSSGRDPASITSLSSAVEPSAFEAILRRFLEDDEDQTPRPFAHTLAVTLISLARHWVKLGPDALQELRDLQRCLGPPTNRPDKEERDPAAHARRSRNSGQASPAAGTARKIGGAYVGSACCHQDGDRARDRHPSERTAADRKPRRTSPGPPSRKARRARIALADRHPAR